MCMLRACDGARVSAMLVWGTGRCGCGECVSSVDDVLEIEVCEMCMCLARGGVISEGVSG